MCGWNAFQKLSVFIEWALCVSALNHCALHRLLKMFVLLPAATISGYKMSFIFCSYTHTSNQHISILSVYFYQMSILRVIMQGRTIAYCSTKWDSETEKQPGTPRHPGTAPFNSSHLSPLTAVLRCGSPGKACCRWEPRLWKLSRFLRLPATIEHLKLFILDAITLLHCPLGCGVHLYLSPVTDDLIELCLL